GLALALEVDPHLRDRETVRIRHRSEHDGIAPALPLEGIPDQLAMLGELAEPLELRQVLLAAGANRQRHGHLEAGLDRSHVHCAAKALECGCASTRRRRQQSRAPQRYL